MTRKQKIERAKARVGKLYRWGGTWRYNYWPDGTLKPGRESHPTDYASAMFERSSMLVAIANDTDGSEYEGGPWRDYVRPDSETRTNR
jgi:cation diffusion facilitator CzcD-associated flavoprotein CzcO